MYPNVNNTPTAATPLSPQEVMPRAALFDLAAPLPLSLPDLSQKPEQAAQLKSVQIPVLGYVKAGLPADAIEEILDYEEITCDMALQGEHFGLKIRGNSMEPRIHEGDVVIIRKQADVESGKVAVVLTGGSNATLKRVIKQVDGITLQAYNPSYPAVFFSKQEIRALPLQIVGQAVELRGKLE